MTDSVFSYLLWTMQVLVSGILKDAFFKFLCFATRTIPEEWLWQGDSSLRWRGWDSEQSRKAQAWTWPGVSVNCSWVEVQTLPRARARLSVRAAASLHPCCRYGQHSFETKRLNPIAKKITNYCTGLLQVLVNCCLTNSEVQRNWNMRSRDNSRLQLPVTGAWKDRQDFCSYLTRSLLNSKPSPGSGFQSCHHATDARHWHIHSTTLDSPPICSSGSQIAIN